jgi:hypothetical protein
MDAPIIIDIDSVKMELDLKLEHIRFVPLETSDECLIGYAQKVLIRDNKIYVADFSTASALFVFDMDGKFLFKIARKGLGPGEYISFHDFDIHKNGDIYIYDIYGRKFIVYNSTGEYQHAINLDYQFLNFCLIDNKMYWSNLYANGIKFANLAVFDMTNKRAEFFLKDKQFLLETDMNASAYAFYYSANDITYYSPKFSNIIFSIDENGIHPAISFKNLKIPTEDIIKSWLAEKDIRKKMKMMDDSECIKENVYIYETDKYIILNCIRGLKTRPQLLYSKRTGKACLLRSFFVNIGTSEAKGSTGKEFFGAVNFGLDNIHQKEILETHEELKNWKEDDNPVIVFFNPDM